MSGNITVCVEKAGEETVAAQIGEILNQTADFKEEILSWGESIADTSARMTIGFSVLVSPFFGATAGVTILSSSFGFYMRVLGPLSMLTYLNLASQQGILVKDGRSLQLLTEIDTVVFDTACVHPLRETGTLTEEVPHIAKIHTWIDVSEEQLLTYAAAAEYKQTHPIAKAILRDANERALTQSVPTISDATYKIGYGLEVTIPVPSFTANGLVHRAETKTIRVGSARFMEMENIAIGPDIKQLAEACILDGHSLVYVAIDDQLAGAIELHATIRPEARDVINELRRRKMELVIISGDHEQPTRRLAQELGIDNYFAETLPENKANLIANLQEQGKSVCFIGDGINDSIALKTANVGISLRGASTIATDTAQIVLMDGSLKSLVLHGRNLPAVLTS